MLEIFFRTLLTHSAAHLLRADKSYVHPVVEYCTTVFSPHVVNITFRGLKQKGCSRKLRLPLNGYHYITIPSAPDSNKIFELESKRNGLFTIFKMTTGKVALSLSKLYTIHRSTTRICKIHYPLAKSYVRRSFFNQSRF